MPQQIDLQNVLNGVSRQPDNIRLASQAQEQVNGVSDPVLGLMKRPGLEHLVGLSSVSAGAVFHVIDRDPSRRFLISCASGEIKAWNLNTGAPATITYQANQNYLTTALSAKDSFRFLTVADYTFVCNTTVATAMTNTTTVRGNYKALVWFKQARANNTYAVYIDGVQKGTATVNGNGDQDAGKTAMTQSLQSGLGSTDWIVTGTADAVIFIERKNGVNFTLELLGSNSEVTPIKDTVKDFADLPNQAPADFKVRVSGTKRSAQDNYWVKFVGPQATAGSAYWEETNGHGITTTIDKATMPHALVIDSNGTSLTWKQLDWGQRDVGDVDTAPLPSFIGYAIEDMFFYRNRFGLLSGENVVLSEVGEFFNFFPTTVTDLLDSDPVDVGTSHTKVAFLKKALPINERLMILSNNAQFFDNLNADNLMTPKTAGFRVRSEYLGDVKHSNVEVAKVTAMMPQKVGTWSRLWEYIPDNNNVPGAQLAIDVTEHVPDFIAGNVTDIAYHQQTDSLFLLADTYPNRIYVYRWLIQENKRVQASWSYWDFSDGSSGIVDFFCVDQYLYVVRKHASSTDYRLGRIDLSAAANFTSGATSFHVNLDSRLSLTGSYDANNDYTTWTLPMSWATNIPFTVVRGSSFSTKKGGLVQNTTRPSTTTVRASGNHSQAACWVGVPYEFLYRFSKFYIRGDDGQAIEDGRTACKSMTMQLKNTGYIKATVSREGQADRTYEAGPEVGSSLTLVEFKNSEFRVPLYTRNMNLGVKITSDSPYPLFLTKAKVIVEYNNKDREY
jgi:hypothetical protein